jgi:hypothetical protein
MKRTITATMLVAGLAWTAAALASGGSAVRVAGVQAAADKHAGAPGDPCAKLDPATGKKPSQWNVMTGSLIGCWYTDTFKTTVSKPNGVIDAIGAEHFVGCLSSNRARRCATPDPTGALKLSYTFEGRFKANGNEVWGHCEHQIVSGTGTFAGASGWVDFRDDVANGTSAYHGRITLGGGAGAADVTAEAAAAGRFASAC